jgi:2-C-methyl-D-erythritol 2,4-cyclodiphosphate synthase
MRVGFGYDIHKLAEGRDLILGGVKFTFAKGLLGHSDADVLVHAVIDALLGAAKKGDIGRNFPDSDGQYKNISSIELLERTAHIIYREGWQIRNVDCVVCADEPMIAPAAEEMERNIARALNVSWELVSVKGKTEEGIGVTSGGAGISAQAVCLIDRREVKFVRV